MKISILKIVRQAMVLTTLCVPMWAVASGTSAPAASTSSTSGAAGGATDYTRVQLASALINYWAAAQMLQYQKDEQLLFMVAPGSNWALAAGAVAGNTDTATPALKFSDYSIGNTLSGLVSLSASKFTIDGNDITIPNPRVQQGPLQFYNTMQNFFSAGDTTNIAMVNPGAVLLSDNLSKMDPALTQQMMNLITNPFPYIDPAVQAKLDSSPQQPLTGADKEYLGGKLADIALMGISTSAWGDIISRRIPTTGQTQSVMEMMDKYSAQRFTSPDWVKQMGAASETALLREMAQMQAFSIWMQYHQYRVQEQQLAATASLLTLMAKMNTLFDMANQQMISAKAQGNAASHQLKNMNH